MSNYKIGIGMHDITGPCSGVAMAGYAMPDQKANGIHMRLRSRAFIIEKDNKSIVYVCADLGMIFQSVSLEVLKKLKDEFGDLYNKDNVILTATHTHSGPGGYSHYFLYNLSITAYDEQNFKVISEGIFESIKKAHENRTAGRIKIASGNVDDAGFNRSVEAYNQNPDTERNRYPDNINKEMTLLKFESLEGKDIGLLNWFAVHPTNIGNRNKLISSDNKGYAAYLFEKDKGTNYLHENTFTAAFANSECGDVSPNIWGYPEKSTYFSRMKLIGQRQYERAKQLFENADTEIEGEIKYAHKYIDMSEVEVDPEWISDKDKSDGSDLFKTCKAAIGISKLAGSKEDGKGFGFIEEGITTVDFHPYFFKRPKTHRCHKEKAIITVTGNKKPPWTPQILPIQFARIGQLGIVAVPFEATTMTARRIKETIQKILPDLEHIIIATYANAYSGYVTTREEYKSQQYEGASTHFGPFTCNAYQQEFGKLAKALKNNIPITTDVHPPDLTKKQIIKITGNHINDRRISFKNWGEVRKEPNKYYARGEIAKVVFWGAHQRNNLRVQDTYLQIEKLSSDDNWEIIARDWDPSTTFTCKRHGLERLTTITWEIPESAENGTYRISYFGERRMNSGIKSFIGKSREFKIQ